MLYQNSQHIERNEGIYASKIDDDLVLIDEDNGTVFGLQNVSYFIWELLRKSKTFHELIDALTMKFDVSKQQCIDDITPFLKQMSEANLVTIR